MLHHAFFPHIIDLIFEFAPNESLMVMGTACRQWRQRALSQIKHLQINLSNDTYGFSVEIPLTNAAKQC